MTSLCQGTVSHCNCFVTFKKAEEKKKKKKMNKQQVFPCFVQENTTTRSVYIDLISSIDRYLNNITLICYV